MGGWIDETNQEVDNLEHRVIDLEGKLVKLAALEAAFDHFTNEHWIPLQAVDLPPFATASDPGPAHSASPPHQRSSHLHDRATASVPDKFPTSSLSRHGSLSEPP